MYHAQLRDPAGSIRDETYDPKTETVAFGGQQYTFGNDIPDRPLLWFFIEAL